MNREKIIEEALKRTPIEGLKWILEDDRFGFGEGWSENDLPECEEEWAGYYIERAIDALKEQEPLAVYEGKVNKCVCGNGINRYWHPKYCGFCGKKLEWY